MSKLIFSNEEIAKFSKIKEVKKITTKSIEFTPEFKIEIAKKELRCEVIQSFDSIGLGVDVIGNSRAEQCYYRWKRQYSKYGNSKFYQAQRGNKKQSELDYSNLTTEQKNKKLEKENEELLGEIEFLKKYMPSLEQRIPNRKEFYEALLNATKDGFNINISKMCNKYSMSRQGYYKHIATKNNKMIRREKDIEIINLITNTFYRYSSKYGYRRILMVIRSSHPEITINHKKIQRIMKEENLITKIRCRNPYKGLLQADESHNYFSNILNRNFNEGKPYEKILTDITYLINKHNRFYLSAAKDSVTGEIVAYTVRDDMKIELSIDVLNQISKIKKNSENRLIHSDQGVHYTSSQYYLLVRKYNFTQSMSRRGNCIDNAPMESFFGHMKAEIEYKNCRTLEDMRILIDQYMYYYNNERMQWNKNKMTPISYRNHLLVK